MSVLKCIVENTTPHKPTAFSVKNGTVYTYGDRRVHYMRVTGGAVVVSAGRGATPGDFIGVNQPGTHFDTNVEVCDAFITITNP